VTTHEEDPLLTPSAVAKRIGVREETVWRWIKKLAIPFEEVGPFRKKRIRQSVADAQVVPVPRGTAMDRLA
jgi:hypothetical protein